MRNNLPTSVSDMLIRCPAQSILLVPIFFTFLGAALAHGLLQASDLGAFLWIGAISAVFVMGTIEALQGFLADPISRLARICSLIIIFGLAVSTYLYRLEDFPFAVHGDVGEIGLVAQSMRPGQAFSVMSWAGFPGVHNLLVKLGFVFSEGLLAQRLSDAMVGIATAAALLVGLTRMFSFGVAVLITGLFIGTPSLIHTFRTGLGLAPPILICLLGYFAFSAVLSNPRHGIPRGRAVSQALCGVCCGLAIQVNISARLLPMLLVLFTLLWILLCKGRRKEALTGLASIAAWAIASSASLLLFYWNHPELINPRQTYLLFTAPAWERAMAAYATHDPFLIMGQVLLRSFGGFYFFPDSASGDFYMGTDGILGLGLFLFAVVGALWSFRREFPTQAVFPFVGFVLSVLVLLAFTPNVPSFHRGGPAIAFSLILAGWGAFRSLAVLEGWLRPQLARVVPPLLAVILGVTSLGNGLWNYSYRYYENTGQNQVAITHIARSIREHGAKDDTYTYLLGLPILYFSHGTIRFLAQGYRGEDVRPGDQIPTWWEMPTGKVLIIGVGDRGNEVEAWARSNGYEMCVERRTPSSPGGTPFTIAAIEKSPRVSRHLCGLVPSGLPNQVVTEKFLSR